MRYLYIILLAINSFDLYGQFIRGSIYASNYDITVKFKPTGPISYISNSVFNFNITVSVSSNGESLDNAPVPSSLSSFISGVNVRM